ncbi:uncharacterized protein LOC128043010 [Gossypium raimondii]|uniref:uncharacterized protein LOC128043010 n=1 Tax=Gossypium raimondii TaxID=29730 RepID=UPI002279F77A|nr:uncharacterized protein LOC128043010 [Gossypium raimondii]
MDPNRVVADDVEINVPAPVQGAVPVDSRPITNSGSTHSYICVNLVSSKNLPVESTEIKQKTIDLRCQNNEIIQIESDDLNGLSVVISSMKAQSYVRIGYETYFAYVLDTKVTEKKIESIPVVCEYPDVFPEEVLGLPPIREVEFGIELVSGTTLISIAPDRMAPTELKEIKSQL